MSRPTSILYSCACMLVGVLAAPGSAGAHDATEALYRTRILEVSPDGIPVDVTVTSDEIRFENTGDEELVICGYAAESCEAWVRLGPDGVFEDRNASSYFVNAEADEFGKAPEDAGEGPPEFVRVRRRPAFYAYHDHRVHWMGGTSLPPGVDDADPSPQRVFDGTVEFRYGDTDGFVRTRLEYVGGRTWLQRYGEYTLLGAAVVAMLVFFAVDARRRRRRRLDDPAQAEPAPDEAPVEPKP